MAKLALDQVAVPLRTFQLELSLEVDSTLALVGPSGAGKSTVLNAIAGLVKPAAGAISCGDETWFDAERGVFALPERRRVGLVFQDYALFPHLTVRQNVEYARRRRRGRVPRAVPDRASGATPVPAASPAASASASRSREPSRATPRSSCSTNRLRRSTPTPGSTCGPSSSSSCAGLEIPTLLVTHDFEDAAALADQVGVIIEGRIRQTGTPADLVAQPADPFVASFTGANLLHGERRVTGAGTTAIRLDDGTLVSTSDDGAGALVLAVYPWDVTISTTRPHDSAMNVIEGAISAITELGNRARVTVGPLTAEITVDSLRRLGLQPGEHVYASFKATGTRVVASAPAED